MQGVALSALYLSPSASLARSNGWVHSRAGVTLAEPAVFATMCQRGTLLLYDRMASLCAFAQQTLRRKVWRGRFYRRDSGLCRWHDRIHKKWRFARRAMTVACADANCRHCPQEFMRSRSRSSNVVALLRIVELEPIAKALFSFFGVNPTVGYRACGAQNSKARSGVKLFKREHGHIQSQQHQSQIRSHACAIQNERSASESLSIQRHRKTIHRRRCCRFSRFRVGCLDLQRRVQLHHGALVLLLLLFWLRRHRMTE